MNGQSTFWSAIEPVKSADKSAGTGWQLEGYKTELMFDCECVNRNITPCEPRIHSSVFDRITVYGGNIYRVQVKHTSTTTKRIVCTNNNESIGYCEDEIDIIAAYTKHTSEWFIVPISEVELRPSFILDCTFRPFVGAWRILKTPKARWSEVLINETEETI